MGSMYSEQLLSHFRHPRNVGIVDAPDAVVEVTNPACGDVLQLSVRIEGGVIRDARFLARGCTATIACGSVLTEWLLGRPCAELSGLTSMQLSSMLGGLAPASQHAAVLCVEAAQALLSRIKNTQSSSPQT